MLKEMNSNMPALYFNGSQGIEPKLGRRKSIKAALGKLWASNSNNNGRQSSVAVQTTQKRKSKWYWKSREETRLNVTNAMAASADEEIPSTASSHETNRSTLTLRSFCGSSVLYEGLEINTRDSDRSAVCSPVLIAEPIISSIESSTITKGSEVLNKVQSSARTEERDQIQPQIRRTACESTTEETWIAKILKDYCPVRLRRNKHLDYETPEFRSKQLMMTLEAVHDQERREGDDKVRHRPDRGFSKSFMRGLLHFEKDEDIVESVEDFIACNRGLPSLFKGTGPAVRRHFFRRWKNVDRDKAMIYDHLKEMWSQDEHFIEKLRLSRELRTEASENSRFLEELFNGPSDRFPTLSFFAARVTTKVKHFGAEPVREHHARGVPPERSIHSHPYFAMKKRQAKAWIKDLLLSI